MNRWLWGAGLVAFVNSAALAGGLVTPFIDVDAGDVKPGAIVPVNGPGGDGMLIFNNEDQPLEVRVTADLPWIHFAPAQLHLEPHRHAVCRIMIHVPANVPANGETHDVWIMTAAESPAGKGLRVKAALRSRLRFRLVSS